MTKKWEVRPLLIVESAVSPELHRQLGDVIQRRGYSFVSLGAIGPSGSHAVGGTFAIEAEDPAAAVQECLMVLSNAISEVDLSVRELQEVVVVPGWRDERDW
ncbi:MAG: hypothetical protein ACRDT0_19955 [Pseudonocardiaceae bacterium]